MYINEETNNPRNAARCNVNIETTKNITINKYLNFNFIFLNNKRANIN